MNELLAAIIAALIGTACWWFLHTPAAATFYASLCLCLLFLYSLSQAEISDLKSLLDMEVDGWRQTHGPYSGWRWLPWRESMTIKKRERQMMKQMKEGEK